jgi:hypothetical protein
LATFTLVTALRLSCGLPTLLAGSVTAAHETPPSATNKAIDAMTFAYVSLERSLASTATVRLLGCEER